MFNYWGNLGPCFNHILATCAIFYFCQSEIIKVFTKNSFWAIRPYDILFNCHIHMLDYSGTPLQF